MHSMFALNGREVWEGVSDVISSAPTVLGAPEPTVNVTYNRLALLRVNPCEPAGPGGIVGIFNLILLQSKVSTWFKKTTVSATSKKTKVTCLNGYHLEASISIIEKLGMAYINSSHPGSRDPLQSYASSFNLML